MKALLQQAREAVERIAYVTRGPSGALNVIQEFITAVEKHCEKAEQPQPVAWAMTRSDGLLLDTITPDEHESFEGDYTTPLYTHPQPSKPLSEAPLGAAVLVDGKTVAWFAEFTESANEWCTENYFGQWLAWRAMPPEIVPLTSEELTAVEQRAAELHEFLNIKEQS